ncbi:MAG: DUF4270 domain-containing protein [Flavobacteriales bacterium]|nr:DUF4270 domain-containing protein [Flavobacteriales bacterium]
MTARPWNGAVLLFGLLVLFSCKRPEDGIGLGLIDPNDTLNARVVDTLTVIAYTVKEEPVRTSNLSRNALGSYVDPEFGPVDASFYTQVRLSTNNVGAGQDNSMLVCDSIVLALVFDAAAPVYGDLSPQRFQAFELAEDLFADSIYLSTDLAATFLDDLVAEHFSLIRPEPTRSVVIDGDTLLPQLRIRMDQELGQRLLGRFGQPELVDNEAFLDYFKGLYVRTDNNGQAPFQGGVLNFDLLSAGSKLTIYYRNELPGEEDTLSYDLLINTNCVRYTRCEHGHDQALEPGLPAVLSDSTLGIQGNYVQALGGTRLRLALPHLEDLEAIGLRALAKAELIVPLRGAPPALYPPPNQMFLFRIGEDGQDVVLPDQLSTVTSIGGSLVSDQYRFVITRYVQGLLTGTYPNDGMAMVPGNGGISAARATTAGLLDPEDPLRLVLTFTTY